jgi:nucleotide-binding universal stress UspA family protein
MGTNESESMAERASQSRRIVVGVDGSDASVAALRWAAHEAGLRGATLSVVTAWDYPQHRTPFEIVPDLPPTFDPVEVARRALDKLVNDVVGRDPGIVCRVEPGAPTTVLLEFAQDAELFVVGRSGLGAVAGAMLGSVSSHIVTNAPCPVTVVPHEGPRRIAKNRDRALADASGAYATKGSIARIPRHG